MVAVSGNQYMVDNLDVCEDMFRSETPGVNAFSVQP